MSSESFSMKEIIVDLKKELRQVREGNDIALKTQTEILGTLSNIDNHLGQLNSKVALHEKDIADMRSEHTRFKTAISTVGFIAGGVWTVVTFFFK